MRIKAKSGLCVQRGKWIHGRCARVKSETPKFSRNLISRKSDGKLETVEQEETLCDEVETVKEFTYLDDSVRAGRVCEATVTA